MVLGRELYTHGSMNIATLLAQISEHPYYLCAFSTFLKKSAREPVFLGLACCTGALACDVVVVLITFRLLALCCPAGEIICTGINTCLPSAVCVCWKASSVCLVGWVAPLSPSPTFMGLPPPPAPACIPDDPAGGDPLWKSLRLAEPGTGELKRSDTVAPVGDDTGSAQKRKGQLHTVLAAQGDNQAMCKVPVASKTQLHTAATTASCVMGKVARSQMDDNSGVQTCNA